MSGNNDQSKSNFGENQQDYLAELNALRDRLVETMANAGDPGLESELANQLEQVQNEIDQVSSPVAQPNPQPEQTPEAETGTSPEPEAPTDIDHSAGTTARVTPLDHPMSASPDAATQPSEPQPSEPQAEPREPQPVPSIFPVVQVPQIELPPVESAAAKAASTTGEHFLPVTDPVGVDGGDKSRTPWPSLPVLTVVGVSLALLAGLLWLGDRDGQTDVTAQSAVPFAAASSDPSAQSPEAVVSSVRAVLTGLGIDQVVVDFRDDAVHLGGPVSDQAQYDSVVQATRMVSGTYPVVSSALVVMSTTSSSSSQGPAPGVDAANRATALQSELDRLLAGTPLIFNTAEAALSTLNQRVLNNVVLILQAYPEADLTIAGFADSEGSAQSNEVVSLSRATNVKDYLVSQGLDAASLNVAAEGAATASGSQALAGLERRVEFIVTGVAPLDDGAPLRIAVVAPSASNDLAFTQSMVDAVNLIGTERAVELAITDNTFVPDEAAAAISEYAAQGFDLVIAHGSQYGASLIEIAPQYPDTAFAWGTAADTFGLPNVYAYDAAAQQGGYLLGALASRLSASKTIGVVGPIEVGDAGQYIRGFAAGAAADNPNVNTLVSYTGSFSDMGLAAELADAHLNAGADVMTGSAQMVVGAISSSQRQGALWFGNQANQASLATDIVVASQVYHWEVVLRPIINDIDAGILAGTRYTADLANGGLVIEYNPAYPLAPEARQWADALAAAISNGTVNTPG